MGNIYKNVEQNEKAEQAYRDALAIAESNGDAKRAMEYQKILDALNGP